MDATAHATAERLLGSCHLLVPVAPVVPVIAVVVIVVPPG
jgi:hypothetical protein